MKMLEAMRDTVALMEAELPKRGPHHAERLEAVSPDLRPAHIREMLATMESTALSALPGVPFSEGKMGRWLGWAQAAVVAMHCATLEDMKKINRRWAN